MKSLAKPTLAGLSIVAMLAAISVAAAQKPAPKKPAAKAVGYAPTEKIVKAKCVGCHQGANPAAGVNLTSYDNVVKGKWKGRPLVVPKDPKASVIALSVHGAGMKKMPLGGQLPDADIKTIEAWISAGAKK